MKTTIIAVTFAVWSSACAASGTPPAQDATTATAPRPTDPTASSSATLESPAIASASTTTTASTRTASPGATSMMGSGAGMPVTIAPVAPGPTSSVTSNPGAGDHTGSADNTRLNARDRSGTLTPIDQGNSKAEIAITASIRRNVMGDHALSFTAKNVKIITVGPRVTLRGPVKSDAERSEIENLARQTAGVTDVDDQLEVKN
jgi:hyperosmotically inducible protein